jgi:hypothetical protein
MDPHQFFFWSSKNRSILVASGHGKNKQNRSLTLPCAFYSTVYLVWTTIKNIGKSLLSIVALGPVFIFILTIIKKCINTEINTHKVDKEGYTPMTITPFLITHD